MRNCLIAALAAPMMLVASPVLAATLTVAPGEGAQERLQEALITAQPGDTVQLLAGRYALTDGLSLAVPGVTIKGAGADADGSVLDFAGQLGSGEGLLVTANDVTLRDFAVENSKGDGIKSKNADRIIYYRLRVEWTGGPLATNGAYGIYPVESRDVLVDECYVRGASDAGIYVGQSDNIIVRANIVRENVAGIEIENSFNADVFDNITTENTAGVLVFDLPNLPQMGGRNVRVFDNIIKNNMTANFAPAGNIVASVPTGTGVLVMANRNVHVFDNVIEDHGTANIMVIGYRYPFDDAKYDPLPRDVAVFDNAHGRAGFAPAMAGGAALAAAMGGSLPPIFWDGSGSGIAIGDDVGAVSLGLSDPAADLATARPVPVAPQAVTQSDLPAITLPAGMEERIQ